MLNADFSGSLSLYLLGLPFIIIIVKNLKDNRKDILMQGVSRI